MKKSIAIDGPAGAGKSTIAKKLAKKLNYIYVDTGAMYRAMALYFIRKGILKEEEEISRACEEAKVSIQYIDKWRKCKSSYKDRRSRQHGFY